MDKSEITVKITYGNIKRDLKCQLYTTLKYIKRRCYDLFYPIKEDIKIFYQNQWIESYQLQKSIGHFCNNKKIVNLKIEVLPETKNPFKTKLKSKKKTNCSPEMSSSNINNSSSFSNNNNIMKKVINSSKSYDNKVEMRNKQMQTNENE